MRPSNNSRGVSLIAAIFIIVILAFMGVMFVTLITTGSLTAANDAQSAQALYIAEGGAEVVKLQLSSGTACGLFANTNVPLGTGSFTTTAGTRYNPASTYLTVTLTPVMTTITVNSTAGYAPQGRIRIENEEINYAGIAGNTFTGAQRGIAGSAAAAHTAGITMLVRQDQCSVVSTGTVVSAVRTVSVYTPGNPSAAAAASVDSGSVAVLTTTTTLASLNTSFTFGDNLIIAIVSFRRTAAYRDILAGNLRLLNGATLLASNESVIRVGGGAAPSTTVFPQETQFFVYQDVGANANSTYNVTALASNTGVTAEVKMVVMHAPPFSSFQDGGNVLLNTTETTIITHSPTLPAGDNIVIAAIQLDNTSAAAAVRTIDIGNLRIRNTVGTTIAFNEYSINLARSGRVNRGTGFLLMARDVAAGANPTYTVTGIASSNGNINGEVKIIVLNGLKSAFLDSGSVAIGIAETVIGSLGTTLPAGNNVVIAANQYDNSVAAQRNILATNERIVFGGAPQASNQYDMNLCTNGTVECDDFPSGLLWYHTNADSSPTYDTRALASAAGINGETKIMAIHLNLPAYMQQ